MKIILKSLINKVIQENDLKLTQFRDILCEKRSRDVIVVDIQPMYKDSIYFDIEDFGQFLLSNHRILYFYNGPDTVGDDTKDDIINMLWKLTESEELAEKLQSSDTIWIDKGYGFFRTWMDNGADIGFIQKAIRYMVNLGFNDSRDIDPEQWKHEFPDDWQDYFEDDPLYMPDISLGELKTWNGSYITGGGQDECLKEVQILMNAFNIKYTIVPTFVY